jgi:hypothetical protein
MCRPRWASALSPFSLPILALALGLAGCAGPSPRATRWMMGQRGADPDAAQPRVRPLADPFRPQASPGWGLRQYFPRLAYWTSPPPPVDPLGPPPDFDPEPAPTPADRHAARGSGWARPRSLAARDAADDPYAGMGRLPVSIVAEVDPALFADDPAWRRGRGPVLLSHEARAAFASTRDAATHLAHSGDDPRGMQAGQGRRPALDPGLGSRGGADAQPRPDARPTRPAANRPAPRPDVPSDPFAEVVARPARPPQRPAPPPEEPAPIEPAPVAMEPAPIEPWLPEADPAPTPAAPPVADHAPAPVAPEGFEPPPRVARRETTAPAPAPFDPAIEATPAPAAPPEEPAKPQADATAPAATPTPVPEASPEPATAVEAPPEEVPAEGVPADPFAGLNVPPPAPAAAVEAPTGLAPGTSAALMRASDYPLSVRRLPPVGGERPADLTGRPRAPLVRPWTDGVSAELAGPLFPATYYGPDGVPPPGRAPAPAAHAASDQPRQGLIPRLGLIRRWREARAARSEHPTQPRDLTQRR